MKIIRAMAEQRALLIPVAGVVKIVEDFNKSKEAISLQVEIDYSRRKVNMVSYCINEHVDRIHQDFINLGHTHYRTILEHITDGDEGVYVLFYINQNKKMPLNPLAQLFGHTIPCEVVVIKRRCHSCHKFAAHMCKSCRRVCYCSAECQKSDWSKHKETCKRPMLMN